MFSPLTWFALFGAVFHRNERKMGTLSDRPYVSHLVHVSFMSCAQNVEADTFWCLSKLLDGIQDHYTFAQPGIQRMIFKLRELMFRIDGMYLHAAYHHIPAALCV